MSLRRFLLTSSAFHVHVSPKPTKSPALPVPIKPPAPKSPGPFDCCGDGCKVCVWDVYFKELEEYKKKYGTPHTWGSTSIYME